MAKIDIFGELHSTTTDGIIADISQIRGADQLGVKDGDVTTSKIADKAVTKAKLDESLQGAVDKANSALQGISASQSGSGNAVTDVSASGGTVTVTKGKTFAEQSALDAVKKTADGAQTAAAAAQAKADAAMPKSGGQFTGQVSWNDKSLPSKTLPEYFVTIEPFASGGKMYYTSKANVRSDLGVSVLEAKMSAVERENTLQDTAISTAQSTANAKYTKPDGGIPKSDLASAVQTSLGRADTSVQLTGDQTISGKKSFSKLSVGGSGSQMDGTESETFAVARYCSNGVRYHPNVATVGNAEVNLHYPNKSGTFALTSDVPSLSNYYTKSQTDSAISTAIDNAITKALNTPV